MTVISFGNHRDFNFLLVDTLVIGTRRIGSTESLYLMREENKIRILRNCFLVYTLSGDAISLHFIERYLNTVNCNIFDENIRHNIINYLNENVVSVPKLKINFVFINNTIVGEWIINTNADGSRFLDEIGDFRTFEENFPKLIWFGLNFASDIDLSHTNSANVIPTFFDRMVEIHNTNRTDLIPLYNLRGLENIALTNNSYVILFKDGRTPPIINLFGR